MLLFFYDWERETELCSASLEMQTPQGQIFQPSSLKLQPSLRHLNTSHISQLVQDPKCPFFFFPNLVLSGLVARLYLKHLTITGSNQYL